MTPEEAGAFKPSRAYFDYCFARIPDFDPSVTAIVGDSLTSDILGGQQAGIQTIWFNPAGKAGRPEIRPDAEIRSLLDLKALI